MKKFIVSLVLLALLAATGAQANWLINSYILAAIGGTRPTLVDVNASGYLNVNATSRTLSVTPPVGTSLLIAYIGMSIGNDTFTANTPTLGGTPLSLATPYAAYQNRLASGFVYQINPTTGVAQNLTFTITGATWTSSYIYVWFFSGVNTSDPFGQSDEDACINCQALSSTFTPEYGRPYIIAGGATRGASGGGNCYTHTNLTELNENGEDDQDTRYNVASNAVLTGAGSTQFNMTCNFGSGYRNMDIVEIKGP